MKKLILAGLLLSYWTASGQDSLHCIPLNESRLVHEWALRGVKLDTMVHRLEGTVVNLESQLAIQHKSFSDELAVEREKTQVQTKLKQHMESLSNSWRDQATYYQKQVRKQNWQKAGLAFVIVLESLLLLLL